MSELELYFQDLMADLRREADASGLLMQEAFFDRMTERLTEAGELETVDRAFYQSGEGAQRLRIDGYAGDPRDSGGILGLIVCDFMDADAPRPIESREIAPIVNPLIRFLKKARSEDFRDSLSEANPGFQVSDLVITTWSHVTKVKLILITNRVYNGRSDAVKLSDFDGVPVTWSLWDLSRFSKFDVQGKEDVRIDLVKDFGGAVPALTGVPPEGGLSSYLMIFPGRQLAEIYERWGERLLEGNVRSFLQARAKTNKGIQKTIKEAPELFFPYNNGLSATADEVTVEDGAITSISNLQIVNGAQTTGSVHAALKLAPEQLSRVAVQIKLTVVPAHRSEEIVPKISEFANTQNKVSEADFSSNHPFHVRMQDFSRKVIFPKREDERHDSKWFYERSRGQYLHDQPPARTAARTRFDLEFPKDKLFSKTDLAKFEFSATGRPDIVSKGAQKNFAEFVKVIKQAWDKREADFDETWFRRLIAKALIFKALEAAVPKQPWYEGGYRANIVTYAMAKVFNDAEAKGEVLDLDPVWKRQAVPDALMRALLVAAAEANVVITHPPAGVRNMSEWAKQQACWAGLKGRKLAYDDDFDSCLALAEVVKAPKTRAMDTGIADQAEVLRLGAAFWKRVLDFGRGQKKLTPKDTQILELCASMPRRLPKDYEATKALEVLARMKDLGFEETGLETTT